MRVESAEVAGGTLRVLLVEPHPLLASALARIVQGQSDLALCGTARTGAEAVADAARCKADVVAIDFELPDMSGPAAAGMIHNQTPTATIVFHSAEESEELEVSAKYRDAAKMLTAYFAAHSGAMYEALGAAADA